MLQFFSKLFKSSNVDYTELLKEGAIIVDVRTTGEFNGGNIRGSRNIPLSNLKSELPDLKKLNKPLIVVCQSGARSILAKSILAGSGLTVYMAGAGVHYRENYKCTK